MKLILLYHASIVNYILLFYYYYNITNNQNSSMMILKKSNHARMNGQACNLRMHAHMFFGVCAYVHACMHARVIHG